MEAKLDGLRWLGAIGGASALALAGVLALAALVAGGAAAGSLAAVFAFTGMLRGRLLVVRGVEQAGRSGGNACRAICGRLGRYGGSADQAGERRRQEQCIELILCHDPLTSSLGWGGACPPVCRLA